jgi:hypothetical protein
MGTAWRTNKSRSMVRERPDYCRGGNRDTALAVASRFNRPSLPHSKTPWRQVPG